VGTTFTHTFLYELVTLFVILDPVATIPVFLASTADARSMCERMTPPKMVPSALVSFGRSKTLIAGTWLGIATGYIFS